MGGGELLVGSVRPWERHQQGHQGSTSAGAAAGQQDVAEWLVGITCTAPKNRYLTLGEERAVIKTKKKETAVLSTGASPKAEMLCLPAC